MPPNLPAGWLPRSKAWPQHNFQLQRRNAELEALIVKDSNNSVGEAHQKPAAAVV